MTLRIALAMNAAFSSTCAMALVFAPDAVGSWLGIGAVAALRLLGFGLLAFALGLITLAFRARIDRRWVLAAVYADFLWVAGTVGVLATPLAASLSERALWTLAVVAQSVLLFGVAQALGLRLAEAGGGARA